MAAGSSSLTDTPKPMSSASWGQASRLQIIPACAGSTVHYCAAITALGDHPRVCGAAVL